MTLHPSLTPEFDESEHEKVIDFLRHVGRAVGKVQREREAKAELSKYPPPKSSAELAAMKPTPVTFTVDGLIREGVPQTLDGDPGIGKSSVAVGMTVARGAGAPIFGRETIQGPALFITHEDDEGDIQDMAQDYADALGVPLAELPVDWWSLTGHDITLATIDDKGAWEPGPFYEDFEARLRKSPRGLFVVLDCRHDVVQMDETQSAPPNTFYKTILTALCKRYGATMLVLCHPSKRSQETGAWYAGSTANKGALRNKLVMKLEDGGQNADPLGPRILDVLKRNRGDRRPSIRLTFDAKLGVFVSGDEATARGESANRYALVVEAVKEMLGRGLTVQQGNTGGGQGPDDVAKDIAERRAVKITPKEVRAIMKAAIRNGDLGYREYKAGRREAAGFYIIEEPSEPFEEF